MKRRKNHNVAVVAAARKLVVIAMHMLNNNEPYRYAQPRSTETKLARLRVRASGEIRRGGTPKGQKAQANCLEAAAPSKASIASTPRKDCRRAGT